MDVMERYDMKRISVLVMLAVILSFNYSMSVHADPSVTSLTDRDQNPVSRGVYGDLVFVHGEGVTSGSEVKLYWDTITEWDGEAGLLNSSSGLPNGAFEFSFVVPEAVHGDHYLWLKEVGTPDRFFGPVQFDVNASISVSPDRGLSGDSVSLSGYGFHEEMNIDLITFDGSPLATSPSLPITDSLGSWLATFTVPNFSDGEYDITGEDVIGNSASTLFNVSPVITLNQLNGSVGNVVQVSGRGFTPSATINSVTIGGIECTILDTDDLTININGVFAFEMVVPSVDAEGDEYSLKVTDDGGKSSKVDFLVTHITTIELEPKVGGPGKDIGIYGSNFAVFSASDVVIKFNGNPILTLEVNSTGEISGVFLVPALPNGIYIVEAEQANFNIVAIESFRVGTVFVISVPKTGPTGTMITLTGTGFTAGGKWEANLDDIPIFTNMDVGGDSTFSGTFYIPVIDIGEHSITVLDLEENFEIETDFTVTGRTSLTFDPPSALVDFNVTVEGVFFAESSGDIGVNFVIYNSTDAIPMDVYEGASSVTTGENGEFSAWWIVPSNFTVGDYWVNATDNEGLMGQQVFKVAAKFLEVSPHKVVYYRGDTVGFNIESSSEELSSYIIIIDPTSFIHWRTDDLNTWVEMDMTYVVPTYTQTSFGMPMTLDDEAPLGTWIWMWYDSEDELLATGAFLVDEEPVVDDGNDEDNVSDQTIIELRQEIEHLEELVEELNIDLQETLALFSELSNYTTGSFYELESSLEEAIEEANKSTVEAEDALTEAEEAKNLAVDAKDLAEDTHSLANQMHDDVEEAKIDAEEALNTTNYVKIIAIVSIIASVAAASQSFFGPFQITKKV
jgi:hypothetical protein